MKKVSVLILGAGGRSTIYSKLLKLMPEKAEVVGVAEPRPFFRNRLADEHHLPPERRFSSWEDAARLPRFADAVIIGTQDRMHVDPAEKFSDLGYHILIEKPLAPNPEGCRRIHAAAKRNNIMLSACHVMRYTNYSGIIREMIDSGAIGKIMSIQHLEPVGHWRFAHSYVRGNWSKEANSSSVLLAKSIHDLDWITYIMNSKCTKISSFGSLMFFRPENRPAGAAERCLDCHAAHECPYNAPRSYLNRLRNGLIDNYLESVTGDLTEESIIEALRTGPYGRCVFACDNDVADHQVVNMEFESGATAVFSLVGCSQYGSRRTTIFGTAGEIRCDGKKITMYSYLRECTSEIAIQPDDGRLETKHNGGDLGCLEAFIDAVRENNPARILSSADVSLQTHLMTFAAEESRLSGRTVSL